MTDMSTDTLQPQDVARYLEDHPDFFQLHGHALAGLTIPAAHGGRAISLHERQLEVLRERNRAQEMRLAEFMRIGQENDALNEKMQKLTRSLLLESDVAKLPALVMDGMTGIFGVPQVALRLWSVREPWRDLPQAAPVEVEVINQSKAMERPYCGSNADFPAATWLPGAGAETRSLALVALRKGVEPNPFGLLVLGSPDPERFHQGMGTAFLERIGEIASAALSRLAE